MALSLSNKSVAEMRIPKSVLQLSGQGEAVTVVVRSLNVEGNWAQNDTKKITSRFIISSILSCSMYPRQDKNFTEPVHFYLKILHKQAITGPHDLYLRYITYIALPAVIVSVSASTGISAYGNSEYCWIESTSYQMWLFVGPVILVVSCNFAIAAAAIRSLFSIKAMVRKSEIQKFKVGIKAVTSLAFLFGLSWIFGILLYSTNDIVFAYLFTILNCPQGLLIFYFHCFRDRNVRDYIRAKFKFGSMIFPSFTVGEANKDVRGKNMHLNEHGIVAKFPVSAENMSRRCKRIERYSTSLNKMPAELTEGSANSVSTLASACDHPTLSSTGNQRNEVVSHH
ncbi:Adhesion G protein-coupled receptor L3 [Trichoplax sp. H2]|nr:Adhesion G protein-coupled receptor L3 [Trichoplax sp. H2]|eukprot:RDD47610.1 Adhesion G protein-coupled receptor L3 [Trichoplax sp. H2]